MRRYSVNSKAASFHMLTRNQGSVVRFRFGSSTRREEGCGRFQSKGRAGQTANGLVSKSRTDPFPLFLRWQRLDLFQNRLGFRTHDLNANCFA